MTSDRLDFLHPLLLTLQKHSSEFQAQWAAGGALYLAFITVAQDIEQILDAVKRQQVLCCVVLGWAGLGWAGLGCAVLCCAVLCCAVLL